MATSAGAAEAGSVDAFASDRSSSSAWSQAKDPKALRFSARLVDRGLAFGLLRGDSAFRLEVNRALTQIHELEGIFKTWLVQYRPRRWPRCIVERDPAITMHRRCGYAGRSE
jgi:ABC-type amino acid transport substrate-binding protein